MTGDRIVVIPTYNERPNLPLLIAEIMALPDFSVLVVDDNSPDGTGELAERLCVEYRGRVDVLHRQPPHGYGRSCLDGFACALGGHWNLIFQMDADLSHDPKYLRDLAAAAAEHDLVIGSRYLHGVSVVNWPLHRIILSTFANRYVRALTGLDVADCTSGFRCWRRDALARLPLKHVLSDGYSFQVEMLWEADRIGCRIAEVPIVFVERREGHSKLSLSVLLESVTLPWRLRCRRPRRHRR